MAFGDRLREVRQARNLSQAEFALLIGAAPRTQQDWERAVSQPNATYLTKMAAMGVDVNYLITGMRTPEAVLEALGRAARATLDATADSPAARKRLAELHVEGMRLALVPPITAEEVDIWCAPTEG